MKPDCTEYIIQNAITIRPHMKYELPISMHVLDTAEDHHQLFVPWAEAMRRNLSDKCLSQAIDLIRSSHEWQLGSLVNDYNGPDTIEGIVEHVALYQSGSIAKWASENEDSLAVSGVGADEFASWYSSLLHTYYIEGFGESWEKEQGGLVYSEAKLVAEQLSSSRKSPIRILEEYTGLEFMGSKSLIPYPSSFSRPNHAYGFIENGVKATLFKICEGLMEVYYDVSHEMLHPLITGWADEPGIEAEIHRFAESPLFRKSWDGIGSAGYSYPIGWLDEILVYVISTYIFCKFHDIEMNEEYIRRKSYTELMKPVFHAAVDVYDEHDNAIDFIRHALSHIQIVRENDHSAFKYMSNC